MKQRNSFRYSRITVFLVIQPAFTCLNAVMETPEKC